jgi:hypothetical protein
MAAKKQSATPPNPYQTSTASADLSPANQIAFEVVNARRDLLPSVERIMNAGLSEDKAVEALNLFRNSLGVIGDPNRDPRVAIATASGGRGSKK